MNFISVACKIGFNTLKELQMQQYSTIAEQFESVHRQYAHLLIITIIYIMKSIMKLDCHTTSKSFVNSSMHDAKT